MPVATCYGHIAYKCIDLQERVTYQDKPCAPENMAATLAIPFNSTENKTALKNTGSQKKIKLLKAAPAKTNSQTAKNTIKTERCLRYKHQLKQTKLELHGALRSKKRQDLELKLQTLEEQLQLCNN